VWEKRFEALDPEERYKQRLEREKPVLDALSSRADSLSGSVAPKSALGKALYYLQGQWPYLVRYLEDGRLELSNNRAERSIKPFVPCLFSPFFFKYTTFFSTLGIYSMIPFLSGVIELDDAYFGAPKSNGKRGRGTDKTSALAAVLLTG